MKLSATSRAIAVLIAVLLLISGTGCSNSQAQPSSSVQSYRDTTAVVNEPTALGTVVFGNEYATIDISNSEKGYIMVKYEKSDKR